MGIRRRNRKRRTRRPYWRSRGSSRSSSLSHWRNITSWRVIEATENNAMGRLICLTPLYPGDASQGLLYKHRHCDSLTDSDFLSTDEVAAGRVCSYSLHRRLVCYNTLYSTSVIIFELFLSSFRFMQVWGSLLRPLPTPRQTDGSSSFSGRGEGRRGRGMMGCGVGWCILPRYGIFCFLLYMKEIVHLYHLIPHNIGVAKWELDWDLHVN